jgi:hypothetical protein
LGTPLVDAYFYSPVEEVIQLLHHELWGSQYPSYMLQLEQVNTPDLQISAVNSRRVAFKFKSSASKFDFNNGRIFCISEPGKTSENKP